MSDHFWKYLQRFNIAMFCTLGAAALYTKDPIHPDWLGGLIGIGFAVIVMLKGVE